MCKITKENDSLQRQTENKDENSQYLLKDVLNKIIDFRGKTPLKLGMKWGGNIPALSAMNVKDGIIKFNEDTHYGSIELYEKWMTKGDCTKGDIVLTMEAPMGNVAQIPNNQKYILSQRVILLKFNEKLVSNEYMYQYLRSPYFKKQMNRYATGTTAKGIKQKNLIKIRLKIPSLLEQKFIGTFLSAIDKKIVLMEKKHTLYQNIKKYFLDNLFPHEKMDIPNLSFKEYSNIWKQIKLKQIIYKGKAGGTPKSSIKEYYNGNIPFLSINDMTNEGKYITYTEKSITEKGLKNSSAWLVPEKSLLYSMYASVGFVSINNIPLTTSQAIFNIIFKEHVNLEFMYYYLTFYKQYLHRYIETGTQGNLNAKLIKNFKIKIPSKEEQRKIADFLSLIDTYIEINKEKLNHLKQFKKGLLQKMFC